MYLIGLSKQFMSKLIVTSLVFEYSVRLLIFALNIVASFGKILNTV